MSKKCSTDQRFILAENDFLKNPYIHAFLDLKKSGIEFVLIYMALGFRKY